MRAACSAVLALVTACAADTPAAPSDDDYANVAISIGSTTAHDGGEVSAMREAAALTRGDLPYGFARGADGAFHGHALGLDYRYEITCHSAAGSAVAPCDATSAGAEVDAAWTGGFDLPRLAVSIAHDASWQLSGISGSITRIGGTGHLAYDTRDDASTYHYGYDADYHLMIDDQRAIGGEIHFAVTIERTSHAPRAITIAADVTFAPDDTAELVLDSARRYRIALATGGVTTLDDRD